LGVKDLQDLKKMTILRSQINGTGIKDIMTEDFPTVGPEDQISQALSVMRSSGYQDVPVVENGNYMGMISYGTILRKKSITYDSKVKNHMRNLSVVADDTDITKLAELMVVNNYRQLPILNKHKKIIGIVSRSGLIDIASGIRALKEIKVWEIMTSPVESVKNTDSLQSALNIMRGLDIRTIPVTDDAHKVIGIVGMKEIIDYNWKKKDGKNIGDFSGEVEQSGLQVETVCKTAPKTIDWNDDLEAAVKVMSSAGISTLPVIDEDGLIGILTQYDIIELISACRERDMLFIEISGLDEKDKMQSDLIYSAIEEEIAKISKISKPQSLIIHVAKYNEGGDRHKYSLSARLVLDGRIVNAKQVDWDLIKAADDLLKKIAKDVVDVKETHITRRNKKK